MRFVAAAVLVIGFGGATGAEEYDCRQAVDGDWPVHLEAEVRHSSGANAVTRASVQIEDDIGYSTTATEPTALVTVTDVTASSGQLRFSLHYRDEDHEVDVATVYLATLSEGAHSVTGGVLRVVGGGLWVVRCTVSYEG
jgi:hypothetical protein